MEFYTLLLPPPPEKSGPATEYDAAAVVTYIPEKGTEIKVKESVKGIIEGKSFSDALFACWIGPKPGPGEKFKKRILGITK